MAASSAEGPDRPLARLNLHPAHSGQEAFLEREGRYYAFVSGVGAGKTVAGIFRALKNVYAWNPTARGYVVSPTVPGIRNVILPELEKWGVFDWPDTTWHATERRLEFDHGAEIVFESADNDRKIQRLRGASLAWVWIDEAATVPEVAWDVLIGRLREGQYQNAFVTTTPKGKNNWVYRKFIDPETRHPKTKAITGISTHQNPHTPETYKEIVEEYEGQFYEQEVKGSFVEFEGSVFDWFGDHIVAPERPARESVDEWVYGVDFGWSNPSGIVVFGRVEDTWHAVDEFKQRKVTSEQLADALGRFIECYGEGRIYCDSAAPEHIDSLQREGLPARSSAKDVLAGVQYLTQLGESGRLRIYQGCQQLRTELAQYQWDDEKDKPVKANDHLIDSSRYALFTRSRERTPDDSRAVRAL